MTRPSRRRAKQRSSCSARARAARPPPRARGTAAPAPLRPALPAPRGKATAPPRRDAPGGSLDRPSRRRATRPSSSAARARGAAGLRRCGLRSSRSGHGSACARGVLRDLRTRGGRRARALRRPAGLVTKTQTVACHVTSRNAQPHSGASPAHRARSERIQGAPRRALTPRGHRWARGASRSGRPPARAARSAASARARRAPSLPARAAQGALPLGAEPRRGAEPGGARARALSTQHGQRSTLRAARGPRLRHAVLRCT